MYVSSRSVLLLILAMMLVISPSMTFAKRGGGKKGGRPGSKGGRPGSKGGRGPPGTGIFSVSTDEPTMLGSIAKSRGVTIAPVNGLTAIYEGKVEDTSTPAARRALLHKGAPEDMVLLSSTSVDGATWSDGSPLAIAGLPDGLIARKPTLSADGSLLFFVGATGELKSTPSAIHVAKCTVADNCIYSGVAFEQPGKVMSGCAYANGKLIVPNAGDMEVEDPVTPEPESGAGPIVLARKLLDRKKNKGSADKKMLASEAWVATCTDEGVCVSDGTLVAIPDADAGADGKFSSVWRGSMVFANGQYQFYGSGKGYWPVVSSDGGATWERATADLAVELPTKDPSCASTTSGLVCAGQMKGRGNKNGDKNRDDDEGVEMP